MQQITVPFASYPHLRFLAIFAGTIGVMQSMAWFGMTITAIIGYNCNISFEGIRADYGSILMITLYQMYFRGDCTPDQFPEVDFQSIENLDLLSSSTVYIWMWVFLSFSFVWLLSSLTLIMNVKKSNLKYANGFLYTWIFLTIIISMIDLALFILFALDYDTIFSHSFTVDFNFAEPTSAILITAQNSAGMMMSVALRGYILWLINLSLAFYLLTQTFKIYDYNKLSGQIGVTGTTVAAGQVNNAFVHNELSSHSIFKNQPIQAFEPTGHLPWYNYLTTDIPRPKSTAPPANPKLVRSSSASGLEEQFNKRMTHANTTGNKNTFNSDVVLRRDQPQPASINRQTSNLNNINYTQTPQPQFEPRPLKTGILRNSRYQ